MVPSLLSFEHGAPTLMKYLLGKTPGPQGSGCRSRMRLVKRLLGNFLKPQVMMILDHLDGFKRLVVGELESI